METSLSSARIGVGIDSPTNEVHIVGHIRIVDGEEGAGKVLTSDVSGIGTWRSPTALAGEQVQELITIIEKQNEKISQLEDRILELEKDRQ